MTFKTPHMSAWCLLICTVSPEVRAQRVASPMIVPEQLKSEEISAPADARQDLLSLRREGQEKGWKFELGYTSAFAKQPDVISGTEIPTNFLELSVAQNEFAAKANGAADESARLAGITCSRLSRKLSTKFTQV